MGNAAALIAAALAEDQPGAATGAAEAVVNAPDVAPTLRRLAHKILRGDDPEQDASQPDLLEVDRSLLYEEIGRLKIRARVEPLNPFVFTDLALFYSRLGQRNQAASAAHRAQIIAPENRHVLRSAARLLIHNGEARRAHDLLRSNDRTVHDPWLLAAELAAAGAARRSPKFYTQGKKFLERDFHPFDLSELASAIGTLGYESAGKQRAHRYIELALRCPTENAVAQISWIKRRFGSFDLPAVAVRQSAEARHWGASLAQNWSSAIEQAVRWLSDQPFSSRPAVRGSYVAAIVQRDYHTSIKFARAGLLANPDDVPLLNNLAFAYAKLDKLAEAQSAMDRIAIERVNPSDRIALLATLGLIAYRSHDPVLGRLSYETSIALATKLGDQVRLAMALANQAVEEQRHDLDKFTALRARAIAAIDRVVAPELDALKSHLTSTASITPTRPLP